MQLLVIKGKTLETNYIKKRDVQVLGQIMFLEQNQEIVMLKHVLYSSYFLEETLEFGD